MVIHSINAYGGEVNDLCEFQYALTVLNLHQKRPKGATTKIQVKRIKRHVKERYTFSDNVINNTVMQ